MMKKRIFLILFPIALATGSCNKFLDVVPDNVPVIDQAFNLRKMAERYLATCYTRLPSSTNVGSNIGYLGADEFWLNSTTGFSSSDAPAWYIAMGRQTSNNPLLDLWGSDGRGNYWEGIYDCNIFIKRVADVPDMEDYEKAQWAAEAKFLKAYYHYLLVRAYGPIIINDKNVEVFADPKESHVPRVPVDDCFAYIIKTIDEAIPNLMPVEQNINQELGRVTQVAAKAIKAEILVLAASPLFNGNTDMALLKNSEGTPLFNQTYDANKWVVAAQACKDAIDFAHQNGKKLHTWVSPGNFTVKGSTTAYQMNLRTAITETENNTEGLWYDSENVADRNFQGIFTPMGITDKTVQNSAIAGWMNATLNIAEKFYTENGVPIEEDKTYPYASRYDLIKVPSTDEYRYDLQVGYTTIKLHLDREPRFYGTLSFDGGRYLMYSVGSDGSSLNTDYKAGGNIRRYGAGHTANTYMSKKYVSPGNTYGDNNAYTAQNYLLPIIRLADLYLLYAEVLNESQGPGAEVYDYVDRIRARSGLNGVVDSWANFSKQPEQPLTKDGMRNIIKQERTIELAFEGKRFYDLRRWKDAQIELNKPILGWSKTQSAPETFYRFYQFFNRTFTLRDYFWPISIDELTKNTELKQNIGW